MDIRGTTRIVANRSLAGLIGAVVVNRLLDDRAEVNFVDPLDLMDLAISEWADGERVLLIDMSSPFTDAPYRSTPFVDEVSDAAFRFVETLKHMNIEIVGVCSVQSLAMWVEAFRRCPMSLVLRPVDGEDCGVATACGLLLFQLDEQLDAIGRVLCLAVEDFIGRCSRSLDAPEHLSGEALLIFDVVTETVLMVDELDRSQLWWHLKDEIRHRSA